MESNPPPTLAEYAQDAAEIIITEAIKESVKAAIAALSTRGARAAMVAALDPERHAQHNERARLGMQATRANRRLLDTPQAQAAALAVATVPRVGAPPVPPAPEVDGPGVRGYSGDQLEDFDDADVAAIPAPTAPAAPMVLG